MKSKELRNLPLGSHLADLRARSITSLADLNLRGAFTYSLTAIQEVTTHLLDNASFRDINKPVSTLVDTSADGEVPQVKNVLVHPNSKQVRAILRTARDMLELCDGLLRFEWEKDREDGVEWAFSVARAADPQELDFDDDDEDNEEVDEAPDSNDDFQPSELVRMVHNVASPRAPAPVPVQAYTAPASPKINLEAFLQSPTAVQIENGTKMPTNTPNEDLATMSSPQTSPLDTLFVSSEDPSESSAINTVDSLVSIFGVSSPAPPNPNKSEAFSASESDTPDRKGKDEMFFDDLEKSLASQPPTQTFEKTVGGLIGLDTQARSIDDEDDLSTFEELDLNGTSAAVEEAPQQRGEGTTFSSQQFSSGTLINVGNVDRSNREKITTVNKTESQSQPNPPTAAPTDTRSEPVGSVSTSTFITPATPMTTQEPYPMPSSTTAAPTTPVREYMPAVPVSPLKLMHDHYTRQLNLTQNELRGINFSAHHYAQSIERVRRLTQNIPILEERITSLNTQIEACGKMNLMSFTPREVAHVLTAQDVELLSKVTLDDIRTFLGIPSNVPGPAQAQQQQPTRGSIGKPLQPPTQSSKGLSIVRCLDFTLYVKRIVQILVILPQDVDVRARHIAQWIDIADECYVHRNFQSLCAIISALTSYPADRLTKTWAAVARNHRREHKLLADFRTMLASSTSTFSSTSADSSVPGSRGAPILAAWGGARDANDQLQANGGDGAAARNAIAPSEDMHREYRKILAQARMPVIPLVEVMLADFSTYFHYQMRRPGGPGSRLLLSRETMAPTATGRRHATLNGVVVYDPHSFFEHVEGTLAHYRHELIITPTTIPSTTGGPGSGATLSGSLPSLVTPEAKARSMQVAHWFFSQKWMVENELGLVSERREAFIARGISVKSKERVASSLLEGNRIGPPRWDHSRGEPDNDEDSDEGHGVSGSGGQLRRGPGSVTSVVSSISSSQAGGNGAIQSDVNSIESMASKKSGKMKGLFRRSTFPSPRKARVTADSSDSEADDRANQVDEMEADDRALALARAKKAKGAVGSAEGKKGGFVPPPRTVSTQYRGLD
ncbi:hypothetical protein BJ742DRAFT_490391 [Cladochytrium replicatum]|nr:hypothetical protein BJ742DRAFT_490391 [Cladochytrium replicatum]